MKRYTLFIVLIMTFLASAGALVAEGQQEVEDYMTFPGKHKSAWKIEATEGLLIGGYGDNFVYTGESIVPIGGKAMVDVDAKKDTGREAPVIPKGPGIPRPVPSIIVTGAASTVPKAPQIRV